MNNSSTDVKNKDKMKMQEPMVAAKIYKPKKSTKLNKTDIFQTNEKKSKK